MVKRIHRGSLEDEGGDAVSSSGGAAAETSTSDAARAVTSRAAAAPARQLPQRQRGVERKWRHSPSLTHRRSPSTRARQSPSDVALFLSKKKGKLVRQEAGPSRFRRTRNARGLNRLGSVLADHRGVQPYSLTLAELRKITNDFSDDQLLGEGCFGKVYKGVLENGDMIAVKKLKWTMAEIQDKQYENEARHLMRLKHPNIVQLVGYCYETEKELVLHNGKYVYAEKSERLLCLEYLPKGSLREHLTDEFSGLDWDTRYKIIKGICYGLHYLHEEWQASTPIIHMDLKPANILLDDNMVPKITDFGLSRLFGEEQTRTTTKNSQGTFGYMAPEYINRGIISKRLDIFSLGVIIMEIVTGHRKYPDETKEIVEPVLQKWRNRLKKAPSCTSPEIDCQQIGKCILIGLASMKPEWQDRPTISQIIKALHGEDGSFDICVQLGSGTEHQYETPDAKYTAGSVTFHESIAEFLAWDKAASEVWHLPNYQMPYTNDPSLAHWYPEQQMASQYASPFPRHVHPWCAGRLPACYTRGLPSHPRWIQLSVIVKWKATVRASKREKYKFSNFFRGM